MAEVAKVERRYTTAPVHTIKRAEGDNEEKLSVIEGIAAKVGVRTSIGGWFDEIIERGAFDEVLQDPDLDCRCLFNHDANMILARRNKTTDTLELFLNEEGHLAYRYTTPNRSYAIDLQDAIASGDISQSSFAFRIKEQSWVWAEEGSNEPDLRKVIKVSELGDVSPVTYPAYQDTEVSKRSYDSAKAEAANGQQQRANGQNENEEQREGENTLQRDLYDPIINSL